MRYESAELAKISINCCLVASVSIANTLAEICENDRRRLVARSCRRCKLDRRIGPHAYLAPGLGIAGGNLERDLATVVQLRRRARHRRRHGARPGSRTAATARDWALRALQRAVLAAQPRRAAWRCSGLAYKENTHSVKNSPSLAADAPPGPCAVRAVRPGGAGVAARASEPRSRAASRSTPARRRRADDLPRPGRSSRRSSRPSCRGACAARVVLDPYRVLDRARPPPPRASLPHARHRHRPTGVTTMLEHLNPRLRHRHPTRCRDRRRRHRRRRHLA